MYIYIYIYIFIHIHTYIYMFILVLIFILVPYSCLTPFAYERSKLKHVKGTYEYAYISVKRCSAAPGVCV